MDATESVPRDVCRRFMEVLATRKQPLRVVRGALARVHEATEAPSLKVMHEALGAACTVALSMDLHPSFIDDATISLAPRLRKPESLEVEVRRALDVLADTETLATEAYELRDLFDSRFHPELEAEEVLPLFARRQSSRPPAIATPAPVSVSPAPVSAPASIPAHATRVGEDRAVHASVTGPFDDEDVVIGLVSRLTVHPFEDVLDEVFAPIFDEATTTSDDARAAYALCAILAIGAKRLPAKIVPRALLPLVPIEPRPHTRGALSFAASVLERLESAESPLRIDAPDADIRGRVRLRIRALRRVLLAEQK